MTTIRRGGLALLALLTLSGCAGIQTITAATTPSELFTLTPKSTFDADLPRIDQQVVVQEPTATAVVATDRIIVQPSPFRVQYLPVARWVDRAPLIVQQLLIESFENSDRVPAVGRTQIGLRPDYVIAPDLREFQAMLPPGAGPETELEVLVRLNIKVVYDFDDQIIGSRSFSRRATAANIEPESVVRAFDDALGGTMRDAVDWSIRTIAEHARRRPRRQEDLSWR
jgi:cholesterol transport system auxiliary component